MCDACVSCFLFIPICISECSLTSMYLIICLLYIAFSFINSCVHLSAYYQLLKSMKHRCLKQTRTVPLRRDGTPDQTFPFYGKPRHGDSSLAGGGGTQEPITALTFLRISQKLRQNDCLRKPERDLFLLHIIFSKVKASPFSRFDRQIRLKLAILPETILPVMSAPGMQGAYKFGGLIVNSSPLCYHL